MFRYRSVRSIKTAGARPQSGTCRPQHVSPTHRQTSSRQATHESSPWTGEMEDKKMRQNKCSDCCVCAAAVQRTTARLCDVVVCGRIRGAPPSFLISPHVHLTEHAHDMFIGQPPRNMLLRLGTLALLAYTSHGFVMSLASGPGEGALSRREAISKISLAGNESINLATFERGLLQFTAVKPLAVLLSLSSSPFV